MSVEHGTGEGGLERLVLRADDGATAEVYRHGAHVSSWRPAPFGDERLFLSSRALFRTGTAIRGGIPVIFPQFAAEGPLPRHGFARTTLWTLEDSRRDPAGDVGATFRLTDSPETRRLWDVSFLATLTVRVGGARLSVLLGVENTGTRPFRFTAALHTYLRLHDARRTTVIGLHGARYRESGAADGFAFDASERVVIEDAIDRVYLDVPVPLTVREPRRTTVVEREGFPDVVLWNPGTRGAAALSDLEPGEEHRMLCVEAAAVGAPVELEPGRRWQGSQSLVAVAAWH